MLRFSCAASFALECVPAFREQCPETELLTQRCHTPKAKEDLILGRSDIGVLLTADLQHSALEYLPLWTSELMLAVPENHEPLLEDELAAGDYHRIADDNFILTHAPSFGRDAEEHVLRHMGIQPKIICEVEENISRCYMLNKCIGNAFVPSHVLQPDDHFHTYSLQPPYRFHIVAAYPKSITLSEPMKCLIRLLLNHFEQNWQSIR